MAKKAKVSGGGGKRKVLLGFLLVLALVVGAGAFGYFKITEEVETHVIDPGDGLDAMETRRKLKLLEDAAKRQARGYVRLSEPEINAHLAQQYKGLTNDFGGLLHLRSAVDLGSGHFTLYTWVQKNVGMPVEIAWQRTFEMTNSGPADSFKLISMKLGQLEIPEDRWPGVHKFLGGVDAVYSNEWALLKKLPVLEFRPIATGRGGFEARLYNYDPATTSVIPGMPRPTNAPAARQQ